MTQAHTHVHAHARRRRTAWLAVISLATALAACGGGGGGGGGGSDGSGTTTRSAAYVGPITGLGSIVVNGVRFETVGVTVTDSDDLYGSAEFRSALAMGMTVSLGGNVNEAQLTGRPVQIRVLGGVRGYLAATPAPGATVLNTVNGQSVVLDASTVYAGSTGTAPNVINVTSLANLAAGDAVEIYGVAQANGDFLATRVVAFQALTQTDKLALRGTIVTSPTTTPSTPRYFVQTSSGATVEVDCSGSCVLSPIGTTLGVNTPVRVLAADTTSLNGGVLTATKIQSLNPATLTTFTGVAPSYAKIKGYTQQVGSDWYVSGVQVTGYPFAASDQFVEVKGTWAGSVLQASRVELESERQIAGAAYRHEIYGVVAAKSGNTFSVQGIPVVATSAAFEGGTLLGLNNGTYVEVKGTLSNGILQAVKVEIKSGQGGDANGDDGSDGFANGSFEVYGTVSGWSGLANTFTLTTRQGTFTAVASSAWLEDGLAPTNGSRVEVKGYLDANQRLVITKLELKGDGFSDD